MPAKQKQARAGKRDLVINTALELFYTQGYHATGIDQIIEEAGVAKMTLYNHFNSKDELLLAALDRRDTNFRNELERRVEETGGDAQAKLIEVFDVLDDFVHDRDFYGCMFVNISAEFSNHDHEIHRVAAGHKRIMTAYLRNIAAEGGLANPDQLAQQLMILFDGTIVTAQVSGPGSIEATQEMAKTLISSAAALD